MSMSNISTELQATLQAAVEAYLAAGATTADLIVNVYDLVHHFYAEAEANA